MTQEDKEILLKDICARLPYSVKAKYYGAEEERECIDVIEGVYPFDNEIAIGQYGLKVEAIKPYLFPLSSMTKEQKKEYASLVWFNSIPDVLRSEDAVILEEVPMLTDFYHKNHFDYRGLIPKGLAIDATGLNIYKNKE